MQLRSKQLINKTGIQKIFTARWKKVPILKIKSHYARISYIMLMMYKEIQQKEKWENYQNIFYFEIWLPWISSFARMKKNSVNLYSVLYIPMHWCMYCIQVDGNMQCQRNLPCIPLQCTTKHIIAPWHIASHLHSLHLFANCFELVNDVGAHALAMLVCTQTIHVCACNVGLPRPPMSALLMWSVKVTHASRCLT